MINRNTGSLFDEFFNSDSFFRNTKPETVPQLMRTDIQEKEGQYLIEIELPGYKREDIQAELKDGYLTIIATRNEALENDSIKTNYIKRERFCGKCKRTFYVGDNIMQEDISAGFKDGILSVIVAKKDPQIEGNRRKLIPIQ